MRKGNRNRTTHGMTESPEYNTWKGMKARCTNPKATGYDRYGGAGIMVCKRWLESFENFLEDMGARPEGKTLERVDGTKGYTRGNCRWATKSEQCNNRRGNVKLTYGGVTMGVFQWARKLGIKPATLKNRLRIGWSAEKALTTPIAEKNLCDPSVVVLMRRRGTPVKQIAQFFGVCASTIMNILNKEKEAA